MNCTFEKMTMLQLSKLVLENIKGGQRRGRGGFTYHGRGGHGGSMHTRNA